MQPLAGQPVGKVSVGEVDPANQSFPLTGQVKWEWPAWCMPAWDMPAWGMPACGKGIYWKVVMDNHSTISY